ncbi:unnamed protein product [Phytophthora fragariaefolia]|uniref:Unnamed protein product n=1 Tax=Phytophthora fragariaefolia TaxID=1490495 RepID=A0A9W6TXC7_9STRA|nr:unnamed protein product [Phytophthora fragariaefolia]
MPRKSKCDLSPATKVAVALFLVDQAAHGIPATVAVAAVARRHGISVRSAWRLWSKKSDVAALLAPPRPNGAPRPYKRSKEEVARLIAAVPLAERQTLGPGFHTIGEGSVISIIIEEWKTVALLKDVIKEKKPKKISCDTGELQLFLAKTAAGKWLESGTEDMKKLKKGKKTAAIEALLLEDKELQGEWGLQKVLAGMPQPSTGQVHVLVVVPSSAVIEVSFQETTDEATLRELERYRQQGKRIGEKCSEYCGGILDKIDEYCGGKTDPVPFICVAGSSGMGKSQLAFALGGRRPYFYWLGVRVTSDEQLLYQNFKEMSNIFISCVERDKPNEADEKQVLDTKSQFYQSKLWTYGLIRAILERTDGSLDTREMVRLGGGYKTSRGTM